MYTGKQRQNPEIDLKEFIKPEVLDLPQHTVTITDISDIDFSGQDGLRLGQNKVIDMYNIRKENIFFRLCLILIDLFDIGFIFSKRYFL